MTRIIAGRARGQRLDVPPGDGTRPTADRVREAVMASVTSQLGGLSGVAVLDLYAGSGALGLEALSRGAARVILVERDRRAAAVIRANIARLGLPGAHVVGSSVAAYLGGVGSQPFDLVFLDPPYALAGPDLHGVLATLVTRGWLAPAGLVVVERSSRGEPVSWPAGLVGAGSRVYSQTTIWYGHPSEPS